MPPFLLIDTTAFNLTQIVSVDLHARILREHDIVSGVAIHTTTPSVAHAEYLWTDTEEAEICTQIRQYFTLHSATDIPAE